MKIKRQRIFMVNDRPEVAGKFNKQKD